MTIPVPARGLGRWLRRHSLTLVATLGGASGVAYAVARHEPAAVHAPAPLGGLVEIDPNPPSKLVPPAELPRDTVQDTVQIALLLDTSSSMDGLINQARSHLWKMVDDMGKMTRVVDGKLRSVRIQLALYEYGNDTISSKQGFIRQVTPFTTDLDAVSEKLGALFTNGGSEYVPQAIETAVEQLAWSTDPAALRFVFVAGNEDFTQGPIAPTKAMTLAAAKDISVQLIHCGGQDESWAAGAKLAQSDLMTIDQDRVAEHIPAPQDDQILALGNTLNGTYLAYGAQGQAAAARQVNADASSAKLSKKVALERSQLKAKPSYDNRTWDLVDAVAGDTGFLAKAKDEELPTELQGKSLAEKEQLVRAKAAERAQLKAQIAKLEAERTAFLAAEQARLGKADAPSLESELTKGTKKIAGKKGYKP